MGCCVSDMIKSAMIIECWKPQSNHRDTFFSIYLVNLSVDLKTLMGVCGDYHYLVLSLFLINVGVNVA